MSQLRKRAGHIKRTIKSGGPKNLQKIEELSRQRDAAKKQRNEVRKQRDRALEQRDQARKQRDEARKQRDEANGKNGTKALKNGVRAFDSAYTYEPREDRIDQRIEKSLSLIGKKKIKILEIGPEGNPREYAFEKYDFEYHAIDIAKTADNVIVANIEDCPEIKDETYDLVLSIDVFEHISKPWLASEEIKRILKKGGVAYHTTLFSWRYHKDPEDYWRYSPAALDVLFEGTGMKKIVSEFDTEERRRSIIGKGRTRITPDIFGGWRENWRVHGIYQKKK